MFILNVPKIQILSFCWKQNIINSQRFKRCFPLHPPFQPCWTIFVERVSLCHGPVFNQLPASWCRCVYSAFQVPARAPHHIVPFLCFKKYLQESGYLDWYAGHCIASNFWHHLGSHSQLPNLAGALHPFLWNGLSARMSRFCSKTLGSLTENSWKCVCELGESQTISSITLHVAYGQQTSWYSKKKQSVRREVFERHARRCSLEPQSEKWRQYKGSFW